MNILKRLFKSDAVASEPITQSSELAKLLEALNGQGIVVTPQTAKTIATVFACVRVLAEDVGVLPFSLKTHDGNSKVTVVNDPRHALIHSRPNEFMTAQEFKELIVTHLCFRGNHYSYINRLDGVARELLPLNPDCVEPVLNDDWSVSYKVTFPNGQIDTLPARDILHIKLFSEDGLIGLSPIKYNANCLALTLATERHGNLLFKNAAMPSGGYSTDKALKDDQYERLKDQLNDYTGEGTHKPLILEGGLKWFTVTMSSEDAQFLQTRAFQRTEICGFFRVPPHKVGILDNATFSNIEHQGQAYAQDTIVPLVTRIEQRLDHSVLDEHEQGRYFYKCNINALLRGDMKTRAAFYTSMFNLGAYSPNDIRLLEDENPREGGDVYLTPLNMTTNPKSNTDES